MKQLVTKKSLFGHTKKGAASIYVVVFATILFGVITLSFVSIILSEAGQSSDDELSRSAYDAALAGVEDAKQAVEKYSKECWNGSSNTECKYMEVGETGNSNGVIDTASDNDCMGMAQFLYGNSFDASDGERLISETTNPKDSAKAVSVDQAYTCVTLKSEAKDFLATLDQANPSVIVPLMKNAASTLKDVKQIEFSWFSPEDGTETRGLENGKKFANSENSTIPSTLTLTLIAVPEQINLTDLESSDYEGQSIMVLLPSDGGGNEITEQQVKDSAKATATNANEPFPIACKINTEADDGTTTIDNFDYACKVSIKVDDYFNDYANAFLVVTNTYNDEQRNDFSVVLKGEDGNVIPFTGAQVIVDSTGRANQLVRRVESRLDTADSSFPVLEYALQLNGSGGNELSKNFYITNNCWTENGDCNNNNNRNGK